MASSGSAQADYHGSIPVGDNPSVAPGLHPLRGTEAPGLCVCECDVGVCSRPGRRVPRLLDSPFGLLVDSAGSAGARERYDT